MEHHQKLEDHFLGVCVHFIFAGAQIIERCKRVDYFCFFAGTDEKSRFPIFGLLFEIKETQISQSPTRDRLFLCHVSWFSFLFYGGYTNVEIISRNFYHLFEKFSWPPYSRRKTLIGFLPVQMKIAEETNSQKLWSLRYFLDYGGQKSKFF
jgi:hypothetical protein